LGEARFQVPLSAVDLGRGGATQAVSCQKRAAGANAIAAHPAKGAWQRFVAWDDFLRLGRSAGVYPRRMLAGAAANGRRA